VGVEKAFEMLWAVLLTIITAIVSYVAMTVRGIQTDVRKQNGRVIKLEEWRAAHEKQDDERHRHHETWLTNLSGEVRK